MPSTITLMETLMTSNQLDSVALLRYNNTRITFTVLNFNKSFSVPDTRKKKTQSFIKQECSCGTVILKHVAQADEAS